MLILSYVKDPRIKSPRRYIENLNECYTVADLIIMPVTIEIWGLLV